MEKCMAAIVTDLEVLTEYVRGVMRRADHHAKNINEIVPALPGFILWRKDDDEPVKVMEGREGLANVLWVRINGQRYTFSYNHKMKAIELRRGSTQGLVVY